MATNYYLIPKEAGFSQKEVFESTLKVLCMVQGVSFEKMEEGVYNVESKTDKDLGFGIDWIDDIPYDWKEDFDPETEKPSGPQFLIRTHGSSIPFTSKFLKLLVDELEKRQLSFNLYDPQESRFVIKT